MANAKRASMREGPLAALFRKTAEDTAPSQTPSGAARQPDQDDAGGDTGADAARARAPRAPASVARADPPAGTGGTGAALRCAHAGCRT